MLSASDSMKRVTDGITNIDSVVAADLLSQVKSLNTELSLCIPYLRSTVQKEETMRNFYEAILLLDDCSDALFGWASTDALDVCRRDIIQELGETAIQLQQVSSYGLKRFSTLMQQEKTAKKAVET